MGNMSELKERIRHRLCVADYHRMAEVGILTATDRVELIDGEIVDMAPIGSRHAYVVSQLSRFFTLAGEGSCLVSTQNPIRLGDRSEPQPDIALLRLGNYMNELPGPGNVLLIVEVADSSIDYDQGFKLDLYARHGIPEVWLLDLSGGTLFVYQNPTEGRYQTTLMPAAGESVKPMLLPSIEWRLGLGKTWSVPY